MALNNLNRGYLGDQPTSRTHDVMVIDGIARKIHNVVVHEFFIVDAEDPILYAAEPIVKWENSESGSWIKKHAIESPIWHRLHDPSTMGYKFAITAKLIDKDYTFWALKWGTKK